MASHCNFSDSKFLQVSKTLLCILVNINNLVVWIVSTCPLISKSSSPFINPLLTGPRAPITICITVTFVFHGIFSLFTCNVLVLISLFTFFQFYFVVSQNGKVHYLESSLFFWLSQGLVVWSRLDDLFVSQNPREICASHFPGQMLSCKYTICSYGQI